MSFHESNPVPSQSSHKRLKVQFNYNAISEKRNFNPKMPQLIQHNTEEKTVTYNNIEEQPNYQQRLEEFGTPTQFQPSNPQLISKESSANAKNQSTKVIEEEEPITSFQQGLNNLVILPFKSNSTFQQQSTGGGGRGAYARYGGGRRGGRGSGPTQSHGYSTIHDKGQRGIGKELQLTPGYSNITDKEPQSTTTMDTQEDTTIDSDAERSVNWKDQVSNMMKDLRESIMVDVKDLMN